jgi:hypothetical protein
LRGFRCGTRARFRTLSHHRKGCASGNARVKMREHAQKHATRKSRSRVKPSSQAGRKSLFAFLLAGSIVGTASGSIEFPIILICCAPQVSLPPLRETWSTGHIRPYYRPEHGAVLTAHAKQAKGQQTDVGTPPPALTEASRARQRFPEVMNHRRGSKTRVHLPNCDLQAHLQAIRPCRNKYHLNCGEGRHSLSVAGPGSRREWADHGA